MPAYIGTYIQFPFVLKDRSTDAAIDLTGWTFEAQVKQRREDDTALLTLTSANGGFYITGAANGRVEMRITAELSATLPTGRLVFDVLRTDADPGPLWLFGGSFRTRTPVTT